MKNNPFSLPQILRILFVIVFMVLTFIHVQGQKIVRTEYNALVLEYDPYLGSSQNNQKVSEYFRFRNVDTLCKEYIKALWVASGGTVKWNVVQKITLNEFPPDTDPEVTFTPENYVLLINQGYDVGTYYRADYRGIINDERFNIVEKVESGAIDAVWIFAPHHTGFWETAMAGNDAYWINGGPITGINCSKRFVVYGFGRESHQNAGFMLENTAHMIENIMLNRIGSSWPRKWEYPVWNTYDLAGTNRSAQLVKMNDWQRFILTDAHNYSPGFTSTGNAQVGTAHFPPGAIRNYGFFPNNLSFNSNSTHWNDGNWGYGNPGYSIPNTNYAKSIYCEGIVPIITSDFLFEGDIHLSGNTAGSSAGFLFRTSEYSYGTDKCKGYYLGLDATTGRIILAKINNQYIPLKSSSYPIEINKKYRVKIFAIGPDISVYINQSVVPDLTFKDSTFITGGIGMCVYNSGANYDNFYVNSYVNTFEKCWYNYPDLSGEATRMNAKDWNEDNEQWYYWWCEHIPKNSGVHNDIDILTNDGTKGILNSWWPYIFDINQFDSPSYGETQVIFPENYEDWTPPSIPDHLYAGKASRNTISIYWNSCHDNIGVTRYEVYRNDSLIQTTPLTSYVDNGYFTDSLYKYTIKARDGSGNVSEGKTLSVKVSPYQSIVKNGSFEEGFGNVVFEWTYNAWHPNDGFHYWDSTGSGMNSSRAICIENRNGNDTRWIQNIEGLKPGKPYLLRGYIKGENITGEPDKSGIGANFVIADLWYQSPYLTGTFNWTPVELAFTSPPSGEVDIWCHWPNGIKGKAWFDNISIIPSKPTVMASNLSFDNVTDSSAKILFKQGNGDKRAIFISVAGSGNPMLTDGKFYSPDETFGKGEQVESGWFCVGNGSFPNNELFVSGLTGGTCYTVIVIEYNGDPGTESYLLGTTENNPQIFTTQKRNQNISIELSDHIVYGDTDVLIQATSNSGLPVQFTSGDESIVSITDGKLQIINAGSCTLFANQPGNVNFNAAGEIAYLLEIHKAVLVARADNKLRKYREPNPDLTISFEGFVSGDTLSDLSELPSIYTTATLESNAGNYPILLTGGIDNNYVIETIEGTLSIAKADQTIMLNDIAPKTYGDEDFAPGGIALSGLAVSYKTDHPDVAVVMDSMVHIVGAGQCILTAVQKGDSNYTCSPEIARSIIINKAVLNVKALGIVRNVGEDNPVFDLDYKGFIGSDDTSSITIKPIILCRANVSSPVGTYDIIPSGGDAKNYEFIYENGKLIIIDATGIHESVPNEILIYPNPFNSMLEIRSDQQKPYKVKICDLYGRTIMDMILNGESLNCEQLPSGIYFLIIDNHTFKLIKEQ